MGEGRDMRKAPQHEGLKTIAARYNLGALYAFGSRAREIANPTTGEAASSSLSGSDLDIGVEPATNAHLTARDRVRIAGDLEDLFGVGRVDLVVLPEADPFLALDVIRGELLYCTDRDAQAEQELQVLRRAADLAPYARERWEQILVGTST
jgi:predicted nucleotidyltransferase